ncbi:hypothetical protein [Streptosporangium saharense]|uniref:hypothetical protein n=1 Tax=Streptosporangium saharense TaxID=1706840 RepID=UPI00332B2F4A
MLKRFLGLGIGALLATSALTAPASASVVSTARALNACAQSTDWVTYARVNCTGTGLSYRVEAEYCRPGSCTWHNGPWVTDGNWSTVSGFSGGGFNQIQYRFQ